MTKQRPATWWQPHKYVQGHGHGQGQGNGRRRRGHYFAKKSEVTGESDTDADAASVRRVPRASSEIATVAHHQPTNL